MKLTLVLLVVCCLAALATAAPHAGQEEDVAPEPAPPAGTDAPVEPPATEPAVTEEPCDHGPEDAPQPDAPAALVSF
ncbi:hypothetical protein CpipJ_CPIJ002012 [Culex quinquefasciatus]|uniref:Uncharacterized protein n=1 Tax=Culex quinquefasciatus TaxID=7176 RepID=B0W4A9_CULQU|nr:hypothetical protein CpipJ_CPIJ002012 [Culex quinquefasciatus]|eukprot:XP_001843551.1 hypothetical protein CpipJ_CPIJ002012 [Culex quinquefasciatus]